MEDGEMKVTKDRYSLKIDGKRVFIWSGALHYYRLPEPGQWKKILKLMKDAGLNAVDVYFPWNYHSEKEGKYDFTGNRDVERLMDEVEEAGLYLIARPGPYICSEIDAGGLPAWLLAKPAPVLRCRADGKVVYDEIYMQYVREWWERITPRIARRKNLILFQAENEFNLLPHLKGPMSTIVTQIRKYDSSLLFKLANSDAFNFLNYKILPKLSRQTSENSEPNPYIAKLCEWSREMGIEVPIFHNDILSCGERQTDVDMMAIDDYPINDFFSDWRDKRHIFAKTDIIEEGHEAFKRDEPIFAAEFQSSWFDSWGGPGYDSVRALLGTDQLDLATKSVLAQRATLINYFLFAGGVTWGYLGSPDVYTSHDMAAPISECGQATERWHVVKWLIDEVTALGEDFLETETVEGVEHRPSRVFCKVRKSKRFKYIFIRNTGGPDARVKVSGCEDYFRLGRAEMKIIVTDHAGRVVKKIEPFDAGSVAAREAARLELPALEKWTVSGASPQLDLTYDDSGWQQLDGRKRLDLDALGIHYGYCWFRGTYKGRLSKIVIDVRHCFTVYVNGKLAATRDNFRNTSCVGDDVPETFEIPIHHEYQQGGKNVIVIVVESLGHNKDFENDARNPRGIVSLKCVGAKVAWRYRGGLLEGEEGLCPVLPKKSFSSCKPKAKIALPHFWEPENEGVALYETTFDLNIDEAEPAPVSLELQEAFSKANIYVNGYLMGRYWHEKGPQKRFYLPWGIMNPKGSNHIAIAVWKRWEAGGLGKVSLVCC